MDRAVEKSARQGNIWKSHIVYICLCNVDCCETCVFIESNMYIMYYAHKQSILEEEEDLLLPEEEEDLLLPEEDDLLRLEEEDPLLPEDE